MKYTNFWNEVESNEPKTLSFEVILLLVTTGLAIGFFAVVAIYATHLGL